MLLTYYTAELELFGVWPLTGVPRCNLSGLEGQQAGGALHLARRGASSGYLHCNIIEFKKQVGTYIFHDRIYQ